MRYEEGIRYEQPEHKSREVDDGCIQIRRRKEFFGIQKTGYIDGRHFIRSDSPHRLVVHLICLFAYEKSAGPEDDYREVYTRIVSEEELRNLSKKLGVDDILTISGNIVDGFCVVIEDDSKGYTELIGITKTFYRGYQELLAKKITERLGDTYSEK